MVITFIYFETNVSPFTANHVVWQSLELSLDECYLGHIFKDSIKTDWIHFNVGFLMTLVSLVGIEFVVLFLSFHVFFLLLFGYKLGLMLGFVYKVGFGSRMLSGEAWFG